jgi:hypothetical protein
MPDRIRGHAPIGDLPAGARRKGRQSGSRQGLSRRWLAAKPVQSSKEAWPMNTIAIVMILIFLAVIGVLNRYEFGRFD